MKTLIIILALCSFGCSKLDCEEKLSILYEQRKQAFSHCGGSFPCLRKIQEDFDKKEKDILNKCN